MQSEREFCLWLQGMFDMLRANYRPESQLTPVTVGMIERKLRAAMGERDEPTRTTHTTHADSGPARGLSLFTGGD